MGAPNKNLIVFTTGSSGSSVLTGLIATQGYWLGDSTKQLKFDTYENSELVDLNIKILKMAGFNRYDCNDIPGPSIDKISKLPETIDLSEFQAFIDKCNNHSPWIWKDPRLSYTIHFWAKFSDVLKAENIFIDRDPKQSYSGLLLSRNVPMGYIQQKEMNENYLKSVKVYLKNNNLDMDEYLFEDLILDPEAFIKKLNDRLELKIQFKDVLQIYKGRLYKKRYSSIDYGLARLKYLFYRHLKRDYITFPRG